VSQSVSKLEHLILLLCFADEETAQLRIVTMAKARQSRAWTQISQTLGFSFSPGAGDGIQGLKHARQMLHHWALSPAHISQTLTAIFSPLSPPSLLADLVNFRNNIQSLQG
jgi:hypothetical protein